MATAENSFLKNLAHELNELKKNGLYKAERIITSQQQADITVSGLNLSRVAGND